MIFDKNKAVKGTDLNLISNQVLGTPENIQNNLDFSCSEDDQRYYFNTYLGQLTYEKSQFTYRNKIIPENMLTLWTKYIRNNFIIQDDLIYITPQVYWMIYKKVHNGKPFITNMKFYSLDNKQIGLAQPHHYFSNKEELTNEETYTHLNNNDYGIYGILNQNHLIYIGSVYKRDFITRWKEHQTAFIQKNIFNQNEMYAKYDLNDIYYIPLITADEIASICGLSKTSEISPIIIQLIEWALIKIIAPDHNIEGVTTCFQLRDINKMEQESIKSIYSLLKEDYLDKNQYELKILYDAVELQKQIMGIEE